MKHNFPSPAIVIPYLILGEGTFLVRSSDFKNPQNKSVVASRQVAVGEKQVRGRRKPGEARDCFPPRLESPENVDTLQNTIWHNIILD